MKSIAVIPGERDVKLIERHAPKLRCPRDVKLRILEVGVCGTDLEKCSFQYGMPPAGFDYLVIATSPWAKSSKSVARSKGLNREIWL